MVAAPPVLSSLADLVSARLDATLGPVRIDAELLRAARAAARGRDESLAQVIRRALRAYVAEHAPRPRR